MSEEEKKIRNFKKMKEKTHAVNKTNSSVQKKDSGFVHCVHAAQIEAAVLFHSPAYSATHPPTHECICDIHRNFCCIRKKEKDRNTPNGRDVWQVGKNSGLGNSSR